MEIRRVTHGDEVTAAEHLFDGPARPEATRKFLGRDDHHLLLAYWPGEPRAIGMISGVEMTHPDKGTEMFLYELGVQEEYQRRGIATALVSALRALAVERGCSGVWVVADSDNDAANATYTALGAAASPTITYTWETDFSSV